MINYFFTIIPLIYPLPLILPTLSSQSDTNSPLEYKDGKWNGQGTYTWSDGGKYVGEFKDNQKNGQGTMTLSSGSRFVGEFKNDKTWNGIGYDKYGNIILKKVNGVKL